MGAFWVRSYEGRKYKDKGSDLGRVDSALCGRPGGSDALPAFAAEFVLPMVGSLAQ